MPEGKINEFVSPILDSIDSLNDLTARLMDLTTRLDERVKIMIEKQNALQSEIDKLHDIVVESKERISIMESDNGSIDTLEENDDAFEKRLDKLEINASAHAGRWQKVTSFIVQVIYAVVTCYILWKFGLGNSAPP